MTAIELNTQKVNLIKDILNETNEDVVLELITYLRRAREKNYPCSFSDAEKKSRIEQSVKDARAGLGVTQESMINRHPAWK